MSGRERAGALVGIAFWGGMGVAAHRAGGLAPNGADGLSFAGLDQRIRSGGPLDASGVPVQVTYRAANNPYVDEQIRAADLVMTGGMLPQEPDCLVVIDGVGNRQGCLVPLMPGMAVETQRGRREAGR